MQLLDCINDPALRTELKEVLGRYSFTNSIATKEELDALCGVTGLLNKVYVVGYSQGCNTIAGAVATIGTISATLILLRGDHQVATDLDIPANLKVSAEPGAIAHVFSGKTLTIYGTLKAGDYQVFNCLGTGKVVFAGPQPVLRTRWWGAGGDGLALDTVPIQAALTASQYGISLIAPPNDVYLVETLIYAPANFRHEVNWHGSTLLQATVNNCLELTGGFAMRNLNITGAGEVGSYAGSGIKAGQGAGNLFLDNIFIQGFNKCLEFASQLYSLVENTTLWNCNNALHVYKDGDESAPNRNAFRNLRIANTYADALLIEDASSIEIESLAVENVFGRLFYFKNSNFIKVDGLHTEGAAEDDATTEQMLIENCKLVTVNGACFGPGGAASAAFLKLQNNCMGIKFKNAYFYTDHAADEAIYTSDGSSQGLSFEGCIPWAAPFTLLYEPETSNIIGTAFNWTAGPHPVCYPFGPPFLRSAGSAPSCLDPLFAGGPSFYNEHVTSGAVDATVFYEGANSWKIVWGAFTDGYSTLLSCYTMPPAGTYYQVTTFWARADLDQAVEVWSSLGSSVSVRVSGDGKWRFYAVGFPASVNPASQNQMISQSSNINGQILWISKLQTHWCATQAEADFWMQADFDANSI